jgi:hypothetical protein
MEMILEGFALQACSTITARAAAANDGCNVDNSEQVVPPVSV